MTQLEDQGSFLPVRLVTFNIRYATTTPVKGEEPWSVRCPKLCAQLQFISAGQSSIFLCLQEVLHSQLVDIAKHLGPQWNHIGVGRDDGKEAGEFSPIFYRGESWRLEWAKTAWLSPTPDVPSRGWNAALKRIVTSGLFTHKETWRQVIVMSTHFDHRGEEAREQSAKLILRLATHYEHVTRDGTPVFLGGDFNSTPDDRAYKTITSANIGMTDMRDLTPKQSRYGNDWLTYTSFGEPEESPHRIDFLFVRDPAALKFRTYGILPNQFDDGVYISDHRPVVADVEIPDLP
jgi:endonuclease/exonuclease/phosphatase family metal-dependent hydrolase